MDKEQLAALIEEQAAEIRSLRAQVAYARLEGAEMMREAAARVGEHGRNYWRDKCEATKARRESRDYETMAIACDHVEHAVRALNPAAIMAAHTRAKAIGTIGDRDGDDGA